MDYGCLRQRRDLITDYRLQMSDELGAMSLEQ